MPTVTFSLSAGQNDFTWISGVAFSNTDTFLIGGNYATMRSNFGMAFENISIPKDSIITNAYIQLTSDVEHSPSNNTALTVHVVNADNPTVPATNADADALPVVASTTWNTSDNGTWTLGRVIDSPDIASQIQSVVSRAGWVAGNRLIILVKDNLSATSTMRQVRSYNAGSGSPQLVVTYEAPFVEKSATDTTTLLSTDNIAQHLELVTSALIPPATVTPTTAVGWLNVETGLLANDDSPATTTLSSVATNASPLGLDFAALYDLSHLPATAVVKTLRFRPVVFSTIDTGLRFQTVTLSVNGTNRNFGHDGLGFPAIKDTRTLTHNVASNNPFTIADLISPTGALTIRITKQSAATGSEVTGAIDYLPLEIDYFQPYVQTTIIEASDTTGNTVSVVETASITKDLELSVTDVTTIQSTEVSAGIHTTLLATDANNSLLATEVVGHTTAHMLVDSDQLQIVELTQSTRTHAITDNTQVAINDSQTVSRATALTDTDNVLSTDSAVQRLTNAVDNTPLQAVESAMVLRQTVVADNMLVSTTEQSNADILFMHIVASDTHDIQITESTAASANYLAVDMAYLSYTDTAFTRTTQLATDNATTQVDDASMALFVKRETIDGALFVSAVDQITPVHVSVDAQDVSHLSETDTAPSIDAYATVLDNLYILANTQILLNILLQNLTRIDASPISSQEAVQLAKEDQQALFAVDLSQTATTESSMAQAVVAGVDSVPLAAIETAYLLIQHTTTDTGAVAAATAIAPAATMHATDSAVLAVVEGAELLQALKTIEALDTSVVLTTDEAASVIELTSDHRVLLFLLHRPLTYIGFSKIGRG